MTLIQPDKFTFFPTELGYIESADGERREVRYIAHMKKGVLLSEAREELYEMFPSTYCQHSYDCCGNFYGGGPSDIIYLGSRGVAFSRVWTLNV